MFRPDDRFFRLNLFLDFLVSFYKQQKNVNKGKTRSKIALKVFVSALAAYALKSCFPIVVIFFFAAILFSSQSRIVSGISSCGSADL